MFSKQRAQRFRREPHTKGGGHEEGPRNDDYSTKVGSRKTDSYIIQGVPHPLLPYPPPWPSPFGRSPEDAVSAARARSGALGSKALGGTLWVKAGWGSQE